MNKENEHIHPIHQQKRRKEGNPAICGIMDGPSGHYAK